MGSEAGPGGGGQIDPSPALCTHAGPRPLTQNCIPVGRGPVALAPHSLMMLFLARRSGGMTLPPGLSAVIYFGSGNSNAVFLSPPSRPGLEFRQDPRQSGGCRGSGRAEGRGPGSVRRTGPVSKPGEGYKLGGRFYSTGRSGLCRQSANVFRSPSFTCK